jgi:hypothetical protein
VKKGGVVAAFAGQLNRNRLEAQTNCVCVVTDVPVFLPTSVFPFCNLPLLDADVSDQPAVVNHWFFARDLRVFDMALMDIKVVGVDLTGGDIS